MPGTPPILFVAGLGRCGTTLAMTMLDAGGFPITGPRPSYEPAQRWRNGQPDLDWLKTCGGRAVKWIDPLRYGGTTPLPAVTILLERDPREQAKSQLKLVGLDRTDKRCVSGMMRAITHLTPPLRARMQKLGAVWRLRFEDVLDNPHWAACRMARLIGDHFRTDFDVAAADAVIARSAECLPDLAMETVILPTLSREIRDLHAERKAE